MLETVEMDDFIGSWHARVHGALTDGLAWLAKHEELPEPDGVIGDFVDVLSAMRFDASDVPHVVALIGKSNPHLQEAGVKLAVSALRDIGSAWDSFEGPLAKMVSRGPVDAWVVEALVDLLRRSLPSFQRPPVTLYRALVKAHGQSPRGMGGIMRNRGIRPWDELEQLYEQDFLQVLEPGDRETVILPILEKRLGTKGFRATQDHILRGMGFDPDEHRARLAIH